MPTETEPPNAAIAIWGQRAVGAFLLGVVLFVCGHSALNHRWPPGFPWSVISLTLLGAMQILSASGARPVVRAIVGVLVSVSAVLWLVSALLAS